MKNFYKRGRCNGASHLFTYIQLMKYLIFMVAMLLSFAAQAQTATVKKESKPNVTVTADGNFVAIPKAAATETAEKTDKTYTDREGKVYPVYRTKKGKHFVMRVSKKTGNPYKYYLELPGERK